MSFLHCLATGSAHGAVRSIARVVSSIQRLKQTKPLAEGEGATLTFSIHFVESSADSPDPIDLSRVPIAPPSAVSPPGSDNSTGRAKKSFGAQQAPSNPFRCFPATWPDLAALLTLSLPAPLV